MKTHMQALNVVGNNIANVNTYGYKAQRVTFKESIYNTLSAGSGATTTTGGTNPQQIGYGCSVGTIDLDMSTGDLSPTGLPTDCAIKGDGFFLVGPKGQDIDSMDSVKGLQLTRVGNFEFRDGYLVDKASGNVVYGFLTSALTDPTAGGAAGNTVGNTTALVPIRLPMKSTAADTLGDAVYVGVEIRHRQKRGSHHGCGRLHRLRKPQHRRQRQDHLHQQGYRRPGGGGLPGPGHCGQPQRRAPHRRPLLHRQATPPATSPSARPTVLSPAT
ncbi:MAG: flagellar hook-basal body complex protein [Dysosmobacter sp.]